MFAKRDDVLPFTNAIRYIFIVRRLGKQSKLTCPYRTLSLTQSELNLRIHGPHGPNAHAGADSQASFNFFIKPPGFGNDNSKTTSLLHLPVDAH